MSIETFRHALEEARAYDAYVTIGGGEPTIHPLFEKFLLEAIAACGNQLHVITNGKITNRAIIIARLAQNHVIGGELSRDKYHDPISGQVVKEFEQIKPPKNTFGHTPSYPGHIGIRDSMKHNEPLPHGRALKLLGLDSVPPKAPCVCEGLVVKPDGSLHHCGCADSPYLGNVKDGVDNYTTECYRFAEID